MPFSFENNKFCAGDLKLNPPPITLNFISSANAGVGAVCCGSYLIPPDVTPYAFCASSKESLCVSGCFSIGVTTSSGFSGVTGSAGCSIVVSST